MIRADPDCVEAARRGDPASILQLMSTCQPDLRRFARRSCSTAEDAEDAVQVALWQLHRKIGALRVAATFAAWMFRIVERECRRLFRGRTTAGSLDELTEAEQPASPPVPADLRLDLGRSIERLPVPYREVLILRDIQELTAPEVAAELGLSVDAVKSRLHRARAMVREDLLASGYWLKDGAPQAPAGHRD